MRRPPAVVAVPLALVVLVAIVLGGIAVAGGDDETVNPPARDGVPAPTEATPTPSDPSALPPQFVRCMADQGFEVNSPDDIHVAPPQVLQTCFGSLHQGGGTP
jgi:hypothetical protein